MHISLDSITCKRPFLLGKRLIYKSLYYSIVYYSRIYILYRHTVVTAHCAHITKPTTSVRMSLCPHTYVYRYTYVCYSRVI